MPKLYRVRAYGFAYIVADDEEQARANCVEALVGEARDGGGFLDMLVLEVDAGWAEHGWEDRIPRVFSEVATIKDRRMTVGQWIDRIRHARKRGL